MEIVVDGRHGWGKGKAGKTLAQVLSTVQGSFRGRKIVALVLDGETLSRERQAELMEADVTALGLLEIRTADTAALAAETLRGILAHLQNIESVHGGARTLLDSGEFARAAERLSEYCGAWDTFSRAIRDAASLAGADLKALDTGGVRADERVRMLNQSLARFRGAMEFRDIVRATEVADKELQPTLAAWRRTVGELQNMLRR